MGGGRWGHSGWPAVSRIVVHYGAQFAWFPLTLIPLTQVVAFEFTMPLWVALLAAAFLGERLCALRIVAAPSALPASRDRPAAPRQVDPGQ